MNDTKVNYLAHFYLAFDDPDLLIGQFAGDAVKGKRHQNYPRRIQEGILLHRHIDHLTDTHPITSELRQVLRPTLGLYSPVAIDIFFDHILAKTWDQWHQMPLDDFVLKRYKTLEINKEGLPERMQFILTHMVRGNWLGSYQSKEGIQRSFNGLAERVSNGAAFRLASGLLATHFEEVEKAFLMFFPLLIDSSKAKLDTFAAGEQSVAKSR